jgi:hypothetical protein
MSITELCQLMCMDFDETLSAFSNIAMRSFMRNIKGVQRNTAEVSKITQQGVLADGKALCVQDSITEGLKQST